jgi:hypothetical protein
MIKKLSISHLFLIINLIRLFIILGIGAMVYYLYLSLQSLDAKHQQRYNSYLLADELRQSSDDLTRFARTYVVSNDPAFEQYYWEVLAIRNGKEPRPQDYERIYWDFKAEKGIKPRADTDKIPLQLLMQRAGFTQAEFAKLREAQNNSDGLVKTEEIAMNLMKGIYQDSTGKFSRQGKPNFELARQLMHNQTYHSEKAKIMKPIDDFFELLDQRTRKTVDEYRYIVNRNIFILFCLLIFLFLLDLFLSQLVRQQIINPILDLSQKSESIGLGDFSVDFQIKSQNEVGKLSEALQKAKIGLAEKATFAAEIGKKHFKYPFEPLSKQDQMGISLLKMRDDLQLFAQNQAHQQWLNERLAKLGQVINQNSHNPKALIDNVLQELLLALNAVQGGVFILNEQNPQEPTLELRSAYAYNRQRMIKRQFPADEGLLGQAFTSGKMILLDKLPENYLLLSSGLGQTSPNYLIMMPLRSRERIEGVIEIASLIPFDENAIQLIEKVCENTAEALLSSQQAQKNQHLLQEMQIQSEKLRSQEEEMRQNMEELLATQELMAKKEMDYLAKIKYLENKSEEVLSD